MSKNLKGKEIGKGICQRKDGLYAARFVNRYGNRTTKYFSTIPEARNWLDEAKYADNHEDTWIAVPVRNQRWSCEILCSSISERGNLKKTARTTRTSTDSATRLGSTAFRCTIFVIHTRREPSNAVFPQKFCRHFLVTKASRRRWTDTFT